MGNHKWSCFECRTTYNREHRVCPHCGSDLHYMGKYFKPPKRNKDKEWATIKRLIDEGVVYGTPHGKRPRHPRDVDEFMRNPILQKWLKFLKSRNDDA